MRVGIQVTCTVCGHMKQPVGRSSALGAHYCRYDECYGYDQPPFVGSLWPGETEEEFGYAIGPHGTKEQP